MARAISEQVVVIVGASSGIGRTTARMAAERGAKVVAAARSQEDLRSLIDEITQGGGTAIDVAVDVTSETDMRAVAATAVERFGRIDTWVGAAATSVYGRAWDIPAHEYDAVMRTNWLGQVHGALAALPHLRASNGTLICIGSVESVRAVPLQAPYTSSKMALRGFCDSLRMDLDADGDAVAVTLVLPAAIDTPFFEHSRSYTDAAPKPPPPVYSPESVARVILAAAEHPRREVVVGGSAFGFLAGQKLAPGLTDRLMTARQSMLRLQQSAAKPTAEDTVDSPVPGSGAERGGHGGRASLTSVVNSARPLTRRAGALGAAAAGLVVTRLVTRQQRSSQDASPTGAAGSEAAAEAPDVVEPSSRHAGRPLSPTDPGRETSPSPSEP